MFFYFLYFLLLCSWDHVLGNPTLEIQKKVDDVYTPVKYTVQEKQGSKFSLQCTLIFPSDEFGFDDQISWIRNPTSSKLNSSGMIEKLTREKIQMIYQAVKVSEVNNGEKQFDSLQPNEAGQYVCFTVKFKIYRTVEIVVINEDLMFSNERVYPFREVSSCNGNFFRCEQYPSHCIFLHYLCDGKKDCYDGSDESVETCNGNPCKDKLICDDGRCIPISSCCDINHDLNCTVNIKPKCCQQLPETYAEIEYGPSSAQSNGARYLFISVCILSILFSIVLFLLILSKVVIFAKKNGLHQSRNYCYNQEDIILYERPDDERTSNRTCNVYLPRSGNRRGHLTNRSIIVDNCDILDPLLMPLSYNATSTSGNAEQPPSYQDVVQDACPTISVIEPPPPYTSHEVLTTLD